MNASPSSLRRLRLGLTLAVLAAPSSVLAHEGHCEGMDEDPLGTLDGCVTHHFEAGEILTSGVYRSLLALAFQAQAAFARGDAGAAVGILEAFIHEVEALSGEQVVGSVVHLAHHAEMAIARIEGSPRG